jgi:hypothetical protein
LPEEAVMLPWGAAPLQTTEWDVAAIVLETPVDGT